METQKKIDQDALPLDKRRFEQMKHEFVPGYDLTDLKYLRLHAQRERDLRLSYRGRAPYELLQNADDAGARRAAFIMQPDGLAFAHDGHWFTVKNFRSLADGWSDKNPDQFIGHKGLGFRSVLDITPAPYLLRVDTGEFFAVKFTWALNNGHFQEAFRKNPDLRDETGDWEQFGDSACPVMAIPGLAKEHNLGSAKAVLEGLRRRKYHHGDFTTMFWFPLKDPDIDPTVLKELGPQPLQRAELLRFLQEEVSVMLPFLGSVTYVEVYEQERRIGLRFLSETGQGTGKGREIEIFLDEDVGGQSDIFYQARFAFPIPPYIKNRTDTPKAVKHMVEAEVVLSVQLRNKQPVSNDESCFHVYFPTQESTGVGFVVHGDFFVKPDRTRLMGGHYNQWLLGRAARAAANEFLTELLDRYDPQSVFAALAPLDTTHKETTTTTKTFIEMLTEELQARDEPFVPTTDGPLCPNEVIMPPQVDEEGFWESHFSDVAGRAVPPRRAFLSSNVDSPLSRKFLRLANIYDLDYEELLDFIDANPPRSRSPEWWYDCYVYMERTLSRLSHAQFSGHRLLPTGDSKVVAVPEDGENFVCLPPLRKSGSLQVPELLSSVFVFLDAKVASLLNNGEDTVRSWVLDRLGIARFEATSFLPRAIRNTVAQLYSGEIRVDSDALKEAWIFMKRSIDLSRANIPAESQVWQELGRFPVPTETTSRERPLSPNSLVPAFLCYWPEAFTPKNNCLLGVSGLRRVDESFLTELILESEEPEQEWLEFFNRVGVTAAPKLLQHKRVPTKEELTFSASALDVTESTRFTGERQVDENNAVMEILTKERLWHSYVHKPLVCSHHFPLVVQTLTLLEGFSACVNTAFSEYKSDNDQWHHRLWTLGQALPVHNVKHIEPDSVYCRGGGGHSSVVGSYLQKQLDHFPWLPTTRGPASRTMSFLRLESRHLISAGRNEQGPGDSLLPYVIVKNTDQQARLEHLGVEPLDDAVSASPEAMLRALAILGEVLSTGEAQESVVRVRSQWRLVRGAIQEMYRALNQSSSLPDSYLTILFPVRAEGGIRFCEPPLYYAEPGSAVERAFISSLPLIDADRPYPKFFEHIGISRLDQSGAVHETFTAEDAAEPAPLLQKDIVQDLAPFLLAVLVAKVDTPKHSELVVRRLQERFEVKASERLGVSLTLASAPSIVHEVSYTKFYLQRRLVEASGAVQETHYILYVNASRSVSLSSPELDADALGEAIAPLFLDGIGSELENLFPRITTRYQMLRGNREAMQEYLYLQLEISEEAQETAWAMLSGEAPSPQAPPPIRIIHTHGIHETLANGPSFLEEKVQQQLADKTKKLLDDIVGSTNKTRSEQGSTDGSLTTTRNAAPTPEQQLRGRRGEEEIKRRITLPGGWEGFTFIEDKRDDGCGFDFLCAQDTRSVKLEIKTFSSSGHIVVTSNELREAAVSGDDYYMIGVHDDGKPDNEWRTFLIQNPINQLLSQGKFDLEAKLQAPAKMVFDLS